MAAQDRLLRAVEYGEITRIGASRPIRVDTRIVAATNEHLPERVEKGTFRADLLDRLSFEVITLPPLRARAGDVMVLADFFGRRMASEIERERWVGFGPRATDQLKAYDWPGNVRELRNVVERAVYRWDEPGPIDAIEIDPFASPHRPGAKAAKSEPAERTPGSNVPLDEPVVACEEGPSDFKARVARFERELLSKCLSEHRYNQRHAAAALGLTYDQLRHALRRHGLLGAS